VLGREEKQEAEFGRRMGGGEKGGIKPCLEKQEELLGEREKAKRAGREREGVWRGRFGYLGDLSSPLKKKKRGRLE